MAQDNAGPQSTDRDTLAAEYVLGVLDHEGRLKAARLVKADSGFATLVDEWSVRLSPLDAAFAPAPPPPALRDQLAGRLFGQAAPTPGWWQSLSFWRPLALVASVAFVLLAGFDFLQLAKPGNAGARLIVSLESAQSPVRFLALYEPAGGSAGGSVHLNTVAGELEAGRDFELWLIEGGNDPVSLGLLPKAGIVEIRLPQELAKRLVAGATLAVTDEPAGGSGSAGPTGPVVASGLARQI